MGFILGFIVGIITKYKSFQVNIWPNILFALGMGLQLSIIMILMPRLVNLIFKGLHPAINDIRSLSIEELQKEIYISDWTRSCLSDTLQ